MMILITKKKKNVDIKDFRGEKLAISEIKTIEEIEDLIRKKN